MITFTKKKIVLKLEDRRKGIYLRASESTTREAHGLGKVCGKTGVLDTAS